MHFGSLVAAVGSWLFAKRSNGRWLLRVEDIDTARVVPGSADEIIEALRRYGLESDDEIVYQSHRAALYEDAIQRLRAKGRIYECGCSRADLQRAASAQSDEEPEYPGTCRGGLTSDRVARSLRFRAPSEPVKFDDLIRGSYEQTTGGDFIVKRADGPYAYQLAVVVDDAAQGITQVIRGGDLLGSTTRQIALQEALGLPRPEYAHLPLVVDEDGRKLGKRDGALPLPALDEARLRETLRDALAVLQVDVDEGPPAQMLGSALELFEPQCLTGYTTVVHNPTKRR